MDVRVCRTGHLEVDHGVHALPVRNKTVETTVQGVVGTIGDMLVTMVLQQTKGVMLVAAPTKGNTKQSMAVLFAKSPGVQEAKHESCTSLVGDFLTLR